MADPTQEVAKGLEILIGQIGTVASVLATVGVLAYAIVDFVKDTCALRRRWQRKRFNKWIARQMAAMKSGSLGTGSGTTPDEARVLEALSSLATAGNETALFSQSLEKMAGLINAALQMAMEKPHENRDLVLVFAHRSDPKDLEAMFAAPAGSGDMPALQARAQARARIAAHIQRSLDGLVANLSVRWERWMRIAALITSFLLILIASSISGQLKFGSVSSWMYWLVLGIIGGLLAPTINDFAKTIGALKKR
jgi:hypothetical protein